MYERVLLQPNDPASPAKGTEWWRAHWERGLAPSQGSGLTDLAMLLPTGSSCAGGTSTASEKQLWHLEMVQSTCVPLQPKRLLDV